jgi:hypothetical protein
MTRIPSEEESGKYTRDLLIQIAMWRSYVKRKGIQRAPTLQQRALKERKPLVLPVVNPLPAWWFYPDGYMYIPCTLKHGPTKQL